MIPWVVGLLAPAALGAVLWHWRTNPLFTGFGAGLYLLALVLLPPVWGFHLLHVGLTSIAVLVLVVEGARTCWMEVRYSGHPLRRKRGRRTESAERDDLDRDWDGLRYWPVPASGIDLRALVSRLARRTPTQTEAHVQADICDRLLPTEAGSATRGERIPAAPRTG